MRRMQTGQSRIDGQGGSDLLLTSPYSDSLIFLGCAMRTINQRVAIACRDAGKGREQERKLCRSVRTAHPTVDC